MHNEHVYRAMGLYDSLHKFGSYKNSHEENNHEQNEFNIVWVIEFGEDVAVYFMVLVINIGELSQQQHLLSRRIPLEENKPCEKGIQ